MSSAFIDICLADLTYFNVMHSFPAEVGLQWQRALDSITSARIES